MAKKAVFCWRILSIFVAGLIYQKIYPKNHRCFGNAYIAWTGEAFETDWKTRHAEAQAGLEDVLFCGEAGFLVV